MSKQQTKTCFSERAWMRAGILMCAIVFAVGWSAESFAQTPAKKLFGAKRFPAAMNTEVHGFYSKGCIQGAQAMPIDGPNWQTMRLSRNRRWGHPDLLKIIESLSYKAKEDGWNGLMVGDISQPRGGPMLTGHASHQLGLDADLWFTQMPNKRLTYKERENLSAISMLKRGTHFVDQKKWSRAHTMLLYHAASFDKIERILVHPGIKKQLCDTVRGDRTWLAKIRPFYGHHYHFHIRMKCPDNSPNCRPQKPTGTDTGCGSQLSWWYNVAFAPKKKKDEKPRKPKPQITLSDLPMACNAVLKAPNTPKARAEFKVRSASFVAPKIKVPALSAASALASKPIEAGTKRVSDIGAGSAQRKSPSLPAIIPVPTPRPGKE